MSQREIEYFGNINCRSFFPLAFYGNFDSIVVFQLHCLDPRTCSLFNFVYELIRIGVFFILLGTYRVSVIQVEVFADSGGTVLLYVVISRINDSLGHICASHPF